MIDSNERRPRIAPLLALVATFGFGGAGLIGLVGCDEGGMEEVGEDIDDAVDDAGDALEDAADDLDG